MQEILGARGEDEIALQRAGRLDRSRDALDGMGKIVDRPAVVSGEILDRAAGEARSFGREDGFGSTCRAVAFALFEIGGHRHADRGRHVLAMGDHRLEADRAVGEAL